MRKQSSALRLLAWKYRDHPLARETFAHIAENADFELGLSAAEALGIDLISYVKDSLRRLILSDKIKAVRIFSDRKVAGDSIFSSAILMRRANRRCGGKSSPCWRKNKTSARTI
jgi:hypothetical protein